jgi:aspartate aminotransferase-like enzyme
MDAALDRIDDAGGLADLARRHEQLRAEVRAVVAELDGLIGDR